MSSSASASTSASSETKDQLVKHVKGWIQMDNEIKEFQKQIKERKDKKKEITEKLLHIMKDNEIDCFDINGGSLQYKKNKVKKPLTAKTLMASLQNYYANTPQKAE